MSRLPELIQYIYFDYDNVLATRSENRSLKVGSLLGIDPQVVRSFYLDEGFYKIPYFKELHNKLETVEDEVRFYAEIFRYLTKTYNPEFDEDMTSLSKWFVSVPFEVNETAIKTILMLKRDYKIGIISNGKPTRVDDVKRLGIDFDNVLISFQVGCRKPEPEIFELAISESNCSSSKLALIDDLTENREAAISAGFGLSLSPEDFFNLSAGDDF